MDRIAIGLIIAVIFISGCIQQEQRQTGTDNIATPAADGTNKSPQENDYLEDSLKELDELKVLEGELEIG
ncbi:MAG: hypothetical protein HYX24_05730 [Candidatus Aenigmarchaeota archaeon]|nr:hypothetical protein [Candidatus Aenigmarchaeota archaeon]